MFGAHSTDGYHELLPGIRIKSINHGERMIMTEFLLAGGTLLPEHAHENEQSGYLVSGRIVLFVDGRSREMKPGDSWCIAPSLKHRAEVLEDSVAIEVFSPVRDDYRRYLLDEDCTG